MTQRPQVTIYTDGACFRNPGPGGYATILLGAGRRKELSGGYRLTTNNRMEILAALEGLRALQQPCDVIIFSDSQYVCNTITKGWARGWRAAGWQRSDKPIPNADLWKQMLDLCDVHTVTFQWIRGHAGTAENERCDQLAVQASKGKDLPVDVGYEQPALSPPALFE